MSKFSVLILGSASATPTLYRNPTSQLLNINEQLYLIDCGEGTQLQLRKYNINFSRIHHIFISHLHGDHYLGLIGLLQTMHLLGREKELTVFGPANLKTIVDVHFKYSKSYLNYPLIVVELDTNASSLLYENDKITIETIILNHKIPCTGFLFKEKLKQRRINPDAIAQYQVPKYAINKLKLGDDFVSPEGVLIKNKRLTHEPLPSYSYAFCSDTAYDESIIPLIKDVNMLYHEATFMEADKDKAIKTKHSTAKEAATIAQKSNANYLIIGHFSNRYPNLDQLLEEAKMIFKKTELAIEGKCFEIDEMQS